MPFVKTPTGKTIFYHEDTPENPPKQTLFFIHGLGSSSSFYFSILPHLRSLQIRSILMDTVFSGLSSGAGPEDKQTVHTIVEDVLLVLKDVKVREKLILVGHSMGAMIASSLAEKHSELLKGLILISPVCPSPGLSGIFQKRIESIEADGNHIKLADSVPTAATGPHSLPIHHSFIRTLILSTSTEGYIALCRVIAEAERPDCSKIKIPVMILVGEKDYLVKAQELVGEFGTSKESIKLETLKGIGHWPGVEDGVNVGKHVGDFAESFNN